jgi:tetratricopeptide (TPR) repeat protein
MTNPWDKMFLEDFDTALKIADENFKNTNHKFDLRARALIKLLQADYSGSLNDFKLLKEMDKAGNVISDDTYLYIGLCYYGLGESEKAMEYFEYPVKNHKEFKYTTDITLAPAILYFMSVKTGNVKTLALAEKDLNKRNTPIAEFFTNRIDENEFEKIFVTPALKNRQQCRLEFYKGVKYLKEKDYHKHYNQLKKTVELKGQFLEFEYYLSKVELAKLKG